MGTEEIEIEHREINSILAEDQGNSAVNVRMSRVENTDTAIVERCTEKMETVLLTE